MHFEGRDIKPYGEPVTVDRLIVGKVYFSLNFADDALLIPILEPVVFIGSNLEEGDSSMVYFQDIDSYQGGTRFDSAGDERATFSRGDAGSLSHIFEFEEALNQLLVCSLNRKAKGLA